MSVNLCHKRTLDLLFRVQCLRPELLKDLHLIDTPEFELLSIMVLDHVLEDSSLGVKYSTAASLKSAYPAFGTYL